MSLRAYRRRRRVARLLQSDGGTLALIGLAAVGAGLIIAAELAAFFAWTGL